VSYQLAGSAGFLAVLAIATPHLANIVSPAAHANVAVAPPVTGAIAPVPVIVVAPLAVASPHVEMLPAYSISVSSDLVAYGDTKTSDFDPEHPPADMGEPG
jgi:hypothetical protein